MAERKQNNKNNRKKRSNNSGEEDSKFRKIRKKACLLCSNKELVLDYKNRRTIKEIYKRKR